MNRKDALDLFEQTWCHNISLSRMDYERVRPLAIGDESPIYTLGRLAGMSLADVRSISKHAFDTGHAQRIVRKYRS